jgi:hypothetical protein
MLALCGCESGGGLAADGGVDPSATESAGTTSGAGVTTSTSAGTTEAPSDTGTSPGTSSDPGPQPEPPITWDLGGIPDAPGEQLGCRAVDFLFVIDNSGSMGAYQTNLVSNFGAFIAGIQATLTEVESYHIGVTTSDSYDYNVEGCRELGSLVVQTGGFGSSFANNGGLPCGPYAQGANYITEDDDLDVAFSCAAQVGTSGSAWELVMDAALAATDGTLAGPGQCNEGFIREDALLVVVIITDEADGPGDTEGGPPYSSMGDPMSWYDGVIAAKMGIPENAAALALVNYTGGPCEPQYGYDDGANIVEFVSMFGENGFLGGICEADYGPIFTEAVGIIEGACDNFVPN